MKRQKWSRVEEHLLLTEYQDHVKCKTIPKNNEARVLIQKFACFKNRNIHQIKNKVQHLIKRNNKIQLELSLEAIHTPTIVHYKAEARVRCVVEKTWALHIPYLR